MLSTTSPQPNWSKQTFLFLFVLGLLGSVWCSLISTRFSRFLVSFSEHRLISYLSSNPICSKIGKKEKQKENPIQEFPLAQSGSSFLSLSFASSFLPLLMETMDQPLRKQAKITHLDSEEISSIEWEFISMTAQEVDLIHRMHRLVGDRWDLIAGRVPGRKAVEIERYWIMSHHEVFSKRRKECNDKNCKV